MGMDCKSVDFCLHRFKSCSAQTKIKITEKTKDESNARRRAQDQES